MTTLNIIHSGSKSSIDKMYRYKVIKMDDIVRYEAITGVIVKYKGKVYIRKDDTLFPSIPTFLTHYTPVNYYIDTSWKEKVYINNTPYLELHKKLPRTQRKPIHAKIGLQNVSFDNSCLSIIWYVENNGKIPFPLGTRIRYIDGDRDDYHPNDTAVDTLQPGEYTFITTTLPERVYTNGQGKYRWKLVHEEVIPGGNLYYLRD